MARWCEKYAKCIFSLILILNLADVLTDFVFYAQLKNLKKGLVYGPVSKTVQDSVLVFAIVGVVIFTVEVVTSALKTFKSEWFQEKTFIGKELDWYVDLVTALGIWCADLPQITLNLSVAACREELVSNVQIAKGVVILTAACIRLFIVFVRCIVEKCKHRVIRAFVFCGVLIISVIAALVFVFTFHHFENGQLVRVDSDRYFKNVSVFVNQKFFFLGKSLSDSGWVKVTNVPLLRTSTEDLFFRYDILETSEDTWLMSEKMIQKENVLGHDCFNLTLSRDIITESSDLPASACSYLHTSENTSTFVFRFRFLKPSHGVFDNSQIFGDILFNVKSYFSTTAIPMNPVRYFRYAGDSGKFANQASLTDIKNVWSTGYFHCESTGNLYPKRDASLTVDNVNL